MFLAKAVCRPTSNISTKISSDVTSAIFSGNTRIKNFGYGKFNVPKSCRKRDNLRNIRYQHLFSIENMVEKVVPPRLKANV